MFATSLRLMASKASGVVSCLVFFLRDKFMGPRLVRHGYRRRPYGNKQKILNVPDVQNMYNSVVELYFSGISWHTKK